MTRASSIDGSNAAGTRAPRARRCAEGSSAGRGASSAEFSGGPAGLMSECVEWNEMFSRVRARFVFGGDAAIPASFPGAHGHARDRAGEMTVENPGAEDTPVDMEKLKASLSCPLCNDMYRFPVTVVSAHSTISGDAPANPPPRARDRVPTFHHPPDLVPSLRASLRWSACTRSATSVSSRWCSPGRRPTRAPSATSPWGTIPSSRRRSCGTEPRRPSWTSCARRGCSAATAAARVPRGCLRGAGAPNPTPARRRARTRRIDGGVLTTV